MQFWRSQKNSQFDWFFLWSNSIFFTFPGLLPKQSYWTWSKEVPACKQMNLGWIYHGLIHFAVDRWIDKWSQLTHNAKYTVTRSHGTSVDTVSIHPFVMVRSMRPKSGNNWFSSYKYIVIYILISMIIINSVQCVFLSYSTLAFFFFGAEQWTGIIR